MQLPKSSFKTDAHRAADRERTELNARWNRIPPQPGKLVPHVPSKDAREMSRAELEMEWRNVARERVAS